MNVKTVKVAARATAPVLLGVLVALSAAACSTPPKPKELVDFEAMRADKYTKRIHEIEAAAEPIKHSEEFYKIALEAYDDEDMDKVKEYSLLGVMRYRTADAIARTQDASDRLGAANDKYVKQQTIRNERNDSRAEIEQTVAALERAKGLRAELEASKIQSATEEEKLKKKLQADKLKATAEKNIEAARTKLAEAEGLKAAEFAPRNYGMGANLLKSAERHLKDGRLEDAIKKSTDAKEMLAKAIVEATPKFAAEQTIVKRNDQNKKLFEAAHNRFRDLVRVDGRGTVVTIASLFKRNKTKVLSERTYDMDFVADLAKKFPDYKILLEGHTDDRGPNARNITISQARAGAARDYFLQRGVKADRMQTSGAGEDKPFFKNRGKERNKNNRVDVIFLNK